jgi:polar amino acid transport system substrate-binding protein
MKIARTAAVMAVGTLTAVALVSCSSSGNGGADTGANSPGSAAASQPVAGPSEAAASCQPAHPGVQTLSQGTLSVLVFVSPPYTIENGSTYTGVDGDIVKKLAEMECLKLEEHSVAPAALIASMQSKRADLAIGGIDYTAQRAQVLNTSVPMYQDGMALLSKSSLSGNLADLKGKKVGVIQGYLWNGDLQKLLGSNNVKVYQSSASLMADLKNGRADVGVFTSAEAAYRAKQTPGLKATEAQPNDQVIGSKTRNSVVLLITKGADNLTQALDADIKTLVSNGSIASVLTSNGMSADLAGGTLS